MADKHVDLNDLFDKEETNQNGSSATEAKEEPLEPERDEGRLDEAVASALDAAERHCKAKKRSYCAVYGGMREVLHGIAPPRREGAEDGGAGEAPPDDEE